MLAHHHNSSNRKELWSSPYKNLRKKQSRVDMGMDVNEFSDEKIIADCIDIILRGDIKLSEYNNEWRVKTLLSLNQKQLFLVIPDGIKKQYNNTANFKTNFSFARQELIKTNANIQKQFKDYLNSFLPNTHKSCIKALILAFNHHKFYHHANKLLNKREGNDPENKWINAQDGINESTIFVKEGENGDINVYLETFAQKITTVGGVVFENIDADIKWSMNATIKQTDENEPAAEIMVTDFKVAGFSEHSEKALPLTYGQLDLKIRAVHWVKMNPAKSFVICMGILGVGGAFGLELGNISLLDTAVNGMKDMLTKKITRYGLFACDSLVGGVITATGSAVLTGGVKGVGALTDRCKQNPSRRIPNIEEGYIQGDYPYHSLDK